MLTVFANMRINSQEGLEHLRDSLESFETASDDWLINIRGARRKEALTLLRERLGERAIFFELLDDSRGWITNALEMLSHAKHTHVLLWNEDHINLAPPQLLTDIANEMQEHHADYLLYSWWRRGRAREVLDQLPLKRGEYIDVVNLTPERWRQVHTAGHPCYLVSITGIFSKEFLHRLFLKDQYKLPYSLTSWFYRAMTLLNCLGWRFDQRAVFARINRICGYHLRRFPKGTPFDLEKAPDRFDMLPLRVALSKQELFACIDDDNNPTDRGSSLVARGLYPVRDNLMRITAHESIESPSSFIVVEQTLKKGEQISEAYYISGSKSRTHAVRETVAVVEGSVRVKVGQEQLTLTVGERAAFYANISHVITALEPSVVRRQTPDASLAVRHRAE